MTIAFRDLLALCGPCHGMSYLYYFMSPDFRDRFPQEFRASNLLPDILRGSLKIEAHISTGLPRSLPNADQCRSIPIKILALIPMPINSDHCRSIPLNFSQFRSMPINAGSSRIDPALIGIDLH